MASSEQIKALLKSHITGDEERFLSIALQVAAHEAKIGHGKLALELRDIVEKAKKSRTSTPISIAKGIKDSTGLLYATSPKVKLVDLVTSTDVKDKLIRIVREQRHLAKLKNHGLSARRKILLAGPPGTGKTYTASILAGELGYPLFQVRLDAVITKFMGESAAKLRQIFDAIQNVRGVYFFDEFDALGSQRQSVNDVGEARRILNSFLQMLEEDVSNSLIVCATNHVEILDHALFRRFDDVIKYHLPTKSEIVSLFKSRLSQYVKGQFPWAKLADFAHGLSNAEVTLAAQDAIKDYLIDDKEKITLEMLCLAVDDRRRMSHKLHV
ncbi:AAA family ATPase [Methylophaga muralis]|uniref:ATP-dependent zinc metalloprotease FtsH n=1 Tax=Methylophaga muralis TaxID=291169 RepID=A0A1E3GMW8_9GAMM|nr:ATP-binding protein [Methylophaga muralis]ODN65403.1 ATP-dependent zinc metalloprotease FtsH [Methylophaga muralis]